MSHETKLPPAILLGADTPIGLTIIRDLGEHGVPVHAVARSREGIGLYSKWVSRGYLRPPDDNSTIELLNCIAEAEGAPFVLAIAEHDLIVLRAAEDEGRLPGLHPLVPAAAQLATVLDKSATYAAAKDVGIPVPATWQPLPGSPVAAPAQDLTFPCVLKWADPESVSKALDEHGIPFIKAEYCHDAAELQQALARYERCGRYPMVQAFCPGLGFGHMIFLHRGEVLLRLQHRRIAEWPPEGGVSTVCESLSLSLNGELFAKSEALLRRISWEGAAMVEYRIDASANAVALMEINGRFWGSLPLAYHAGVPFAWYTYAVLGLGMRPHPPHYRAGIRCRFMLPETRRILTLLRCRGRLKIGARVPVPYEICEYFRQFLTPRTRYYVLTFRDPAPFFADMFFMIWRLWRRFRQMRHSASAAR